MKLRDFPVLVVDDNSTNRKILEEMIANWRMKPVVAPNGPAALDALHRAHQNGTPFRLVLLDGHMPDMDGFEVAARVKQDPQLHGAKVILLTSAGRSEDVARAKAVGVAAALCKPVKQSELWDAIISVLHVPGRQKARPSAARTRAARQPLRVLLAEDNPVNQEVAVQMLERRGHSGWRRKAAIEPRMRWGRSIGVSRRVLAERPWESEVNPVDGVAVHDCEPTILGKA